MISAIEILLHWSECGINLQSAQRHLACWTRQMFALHQELLATSQSQQRDRSNAYQVTYLMVLFQTCLDNRQDFSRHILNAWRKLMFLRLPIQEAVVPSGVVSGQVRPMTRLDRVSYYLYRYCSEKFGFDCSTTWLFCITLGVAVLISLLM